MYQQVVMSVSITALRLNKLPWNIHIFKALTVIEAYFYRIIYRSILLLNYFDGYMLQGANILNFWTQADFTAQILQTMRLNPLFNAVFDIDSNEHAIDFGPGVLCEIISKYANRNTIIFLNTYLPETIFRTAFVNIPNTVSATLILTVIHKRESARFLSGDADKTSTKRLKQLAF